MMDLSKRPGYHLMLDIMPLIGIIAARLELSNVHGDHDAPLTTDEDLALLAAGLRHIEHLLEDLDDELHITRGMPL